MFENRIFKKFKFFLLKFNMFCIFWCADVKNDFLKIKKNHWHVFQHKRLFEKQPLPHYQRERERERGLVFVPVWLWKITFLKLGGKKGQFLRLTQLFCLWKHGLVNSNILSRSLCFPQDAELESLVLRHFYVLWSGIFLHHASCWG
jgi:hypothetical protein